MVELTIGEVARRAGLNPSAPRWYERSGLLPTPRRVSGRRRYEPGVLQHLAVIRLAQEVGFTIAEIRTLLDGFDPDASPGQSWQPFATKKRAEIEQIIARAEQARSLLDAILDCACPTLGGCNPVTRRTPAVPPTGVPQVAV